MRTLIWPVTSRKNSYSIARSSQHHRVTLSAMDHEAVGHWFNEEVRDDPGLLDEVEAAIEDVKGKFIFHRPFLSTSSRHVISVSAAPTAKCDKWRIIAG
jgi:hypothetical protein